MIFRQGTPRSPRVLRTSSRYRAYCGTCLPSGRAKTVIFSSGFAKSTDLTSPLGRPKSIVLLVIEMEIGGGLQKRTGYNGNVSDSPATKMLAAIRIAAVPAMRGWLAPNSATYQRTVIQTPRRATQI